MQHSAVKSKTYTLANIESLRLNTEEPKNSAGIQLGIPAEFLSFS